MNEADAYAQRVKTYCERAEAARQNLSVPVCFFEGQKLAWVNENGSIHFRSQDYSQREALVLARWIYWALDTTLTPKIDYFSMPISELKLKTKRSLYGLMHANIKTVGDLSARTERELLKGRNIGKSTILDIKQALDQIGLSLASAKVISCALGKP